MEQGFSGSSCALKQQTYWFQSVISLAIFHKKIQNLFFCWIFIHEYCTTPLPRRIPTDNYHRSKKQILFADQHKNHQTSQQQHNTTTMTTTTTTSTRINLTMAKTQRMPKGASPQSSKRTVWDDNISDNNNDNDGSKRKSKKNKKRQCQKQKGQHWKQNSCSNFGSRCRQQRSNTHCWTQEFTQ